MSAAVRERTDCCRQKTDLRACQMTEIDRYCPRRGYRNSTQGKLGDSPASTRRRQAQHESGSVSGAIGKDVKRVVVPRFIEIDFFSDNTARRHQQSAREGRCADGLDCFVDHLEESHEFFVLLDLKLKLGSLPVCHLHFDCARCSRLFGKRHVSSLSVCPGPLRNPEVGSTQ